MSIKSVVLFFVATVAACSTSQAASLTVVPNLFEGKRPMIEQLTPDGNSITGVAGNEIFRWTPSGGRESVGNLGTETNIFWSAMSVDGSTVVGRRIGWYSEELVRWTSAGGVEVLDTTSSHPYNPYPWHSSDDGSVIYGRSYNMFTQPREELYDLGLLPTRDNVYYQEGQEANFRWDGSNGFSILPNRHPIPLFGQWTMMDVSADGTVVAGTLNSMPFVWSEATGFQGPINSPSYAGALVSHLSADGSTLVGGYRPDFSITRAFRWRVGGEIEPLTDGTEVYSSAYLVSADGRVIVGSVWEQGAEGSDNYIWRDGFERQSIADYFADQGLTIPFPGYHSIVEMSRDGMVFRGSTANPTGMVNGQPTFDSTSWLIDLRNVVPEPNACGLAAAALCMFGASVRTRRLAKRN